ncbi:hypothetical protein [Carboxylicivirga caseinilyticus]|uniref:hypothetical protein n=1 Tax=Carboxylicivirga caseinilyticus TaxID=3417572 RepID=UPI003D3446BF|nr:hypothetical protein [Marinilabiliaceae bacterium A049]
MRGIRFKEVLKKWWWLLLLPLLFFIPFKKWMTKISGFGNVDVYKSISDILYSSMQNWGTDEKAMFNALGNLDGFELVKVYEAFGNKSYAFGGASFAMNSLDLFGWFAKELSGKDLIKMRNIWNKSGLNITF